MFRKLLITLFLFLLISLSGYSQELLLPQSAQFSVSISVPEKATKSIMDLGDILEIDVKITNNSLKTIVFHSPLPLPKFGWKVMKDSIEYEWQFPSSFDRHTYPQKTLEVKSYQSTTVRILCYLNNLTTKDG